MNTLTLHKTPILIVLVIISAYTLMPITTNGITTNNALSIMNTTYVPVSVKVRVTGSWGNEYTDIVFTITIMLPQYIVLEPLKVYYVNVTMTSELGIGGIGDWDNGIRYIDIIDLETMDKILTINLGNAVIEEYVNVDPAVKQFPISFSPDGKTVNFTAALVIPDDPQLIEKLLKRKVVAVVIRPSFEGIGIYSYPNWYYHDYLECNITYVDMPAKIYFMEESSNINTTNDIYSGATTTVTTTITSIITRTITKTFTATQTISRTIWLTYTKTTTTPITITKTITKYMNNTLTTTYVHTITSKIYIPVNKTITYTITTTQPVTTKTTTIMLTQTTTTTHTILTTTTIYTGSETPSFLTTIISAIILLAGIVTAIAVSRG